MTEIIAVNAPHPKVRDRWGLALALLRPTIQRVNRGKVPSCIWGAHG